MPKGSEVSIKTVNGVNGVYLISPPTISIEKMELTQKSIKGGIVNFELTATFTVKNQPKGVVITNVR